MIMLRNQKGIVLITAYMVILVLAVLSAALFMRTFQEKRLSQQQNESMKAFYNAEKALSYAYLESANAGWAWYTHNWDTNQTPQRAVSNNLGPAGAVRTDAQRTPSPDCHFIASGLADEGCYVANDGSFILKTFSDPHSANMTVVRARGISGNVERVIEARIRHDPIYDFAFWTPYNMNLGSVGGGASGSNVFINGGRIHTNGNISMDWQTKRFFNVDTISTGKDKGIYYTWRTYIPPGYFDTNVDGSGTLDGKAPIPHLGKPDVGQNARRWAGTTDSQSYPTQYPWKYEQLPGVWNWRNIYAWYRTDSYAGSWPPREWRYTAEFFSGGARSWIYPAQKDENGNLVFDVNGNPIYEPKQEIPQRLTGAMWDWEKYWDYGTIGGNPQQPLNFVVYDPTTQGTKPVEDTRWKIITNLDSSKSVVMTELSDPQGVTYWQMLQKPEYWTAIGQSSNTVNTLNPEVLDGTYGNDFSQRTIPVDYTNSMKQPEAWNAWLLASGMDDVLLTNENGVDMEPPRFGTTYKEKSKRGGLYLSESAGTHTLYYGNGNMVTYTVTEAQACGPCGSIACSTNIDNTTSNDNWLACIEARIDALVDRLNTAPDGTPLPYEQRAARKVEFINTYTAKQNVVLEIDIGKMKDARTFPANGFLYSEVPIRLTNASQLPYLGQDAADDTFNIISEENIYLKGDYNNPASDNLWMTSAIVSKKYIYTLSDNFNDPQVTPAPVNYPSYPAVYANVKPDGTLEEGNPSAGGGIWVQENTYPSGSAQNNYVIALRNAMQADWQATFNVNDPSASNLYTISSTHPLINGKTWGAMPNRVQQNQTYNALLASYYTYGGGRSWAVYYNQPAGGIPYGNILERWYDDAGATRTRALKGAYFQLDWGEEDCLTRFTAHKSDGPLDGYFYATYNNRGAYGGNPVWGTAYYVSAPNTSSAYDSRFRDPSLDTNKPIFFGGGESSWRELPITSF